MDKENKQINILKDNQKKDDLKKNIKDIVVKEIAEQMKSGLFTSRKLTDTPVDSLQVVNRRFVTLNGVTASRPTSSIIGQYYFDTTLGYPVYWSGTTWVDATGTPA